MNDFFAELRRRHVFKVAIAYVVTAWLVLQLADIMLPAFGAPVWVIKVVIGLFVLCFPIALILGWAFELTPDGVRRTEPAAAPSQPASRMPARRMRPSLNTITLVMLTAAVAVLAWRQFVGHATSSGPATKSAAPASDSASAIPAKSVAVLPCVNMSGDSAEAYFSEGITDEILNALAQIPGLKVPGRTSSFVFEGKNENLSDIGRALRVATVLECSVQRSPKQVRITAQLIDAHTDYHLWSHRYDRELKNIFAVEDQISAAIADALKLKLGISAGSRQAGGTADPRAHDLYLLGLHYWNLRTPADQRRAIGYFRQAIARDSGYAGAWAALAIALVTPATSLIDTLPASIALPRGEAAARRALAIDSTLPEAHTALAFGLMTYDYDWKASRAEFERAVEVDPDYPTAHSWLSEWYASQGRTAEAVESSRRAVELDPLSMIIGWTLGRELIFDRQYAEARKQLEEVRAQHPGEGRVVGLLVDATFLQGDTLAAVRYLLAGRANLPDSVRALFQEAISSGNAERLRRPRRNPIVGFAHHFDRRISGMDSAFADIRRAVDSRNIGDDLVDLVAEPQFDPVRSDPRYQQILQRLGLEAAGHRIASKMLSRER